MITKKDIVYKRYGLNPAKAYSLPQLATITDTPLSVLKKVEARGYGAYTTNPQSVRNATTFIKGQGPMSQRLSPQAWAKARVFSFLSGSKRHDTDLGKSYRK